MSDLSPNAHQSEHPPAHSDFIVQALVELIRHPRGRIFDGIKRVGEADICTSIVVAAELRFGAAKKNAPRLAKQLVAVLGAIEVLALETPVDATYGGAIRNALDNASQPVGANDLWIALTPSPWAIRL